MQESRDSVTRNEMAGTAADPLRRVKLELGVILLLAVVAWLLVERLVESWWWQLAALSAYGMIGMMWLVLRARRVMRQLTRRETSV